MKRFNGQVFLFVIVLGFMFYGIIQFWKNYCFGLLEHLDVFLAKDPNMLLVVVCIGLIGVLAEIISRI